MEKRTAPGGRVVSVRLPVEVIERLDRLAETTQRSRGYYLREAIEELLPTMEAATGRTRSMSGIRWSGVHSGVSWRS